MQSYYEERKHLNYYKKVVKLVDRLNYETIIDVGARKSPVFESLRNQTAHMTVLDIEPFEHMLPNIEYICADFYKWEPTRQYDVVLCLQVLEHLDDPASFCTRLFELGKNVIISVPYKWRKGSCRSHVQDPVDEAKLFSWTKRRPSEKYIIDDNRVLRMICTYPQN